MIRTMENDEQPRRYREPHRYAHPPQDTDWFLWSMVLLFVVLFGASVVGLYFLVFEGGF